MLCKGMCLLDVACTAATTRCRRGNHRAEPLQQLPTALLHICDLFSMKRLLPSFYVAAGCCCPACIT
jgi:hypothetical protein